MYNSKKKTKTMTDKLKKINYYPVKDGNPRGNSLCGNTYELIKHVARVCILIGI